MPDDFDSEEENESGSSLRKKLEAALKDNATLAAKVKEVEVKQLIADKGYKHLSVDDFKDVSLSELEAKAEELETQKADQDMAALRRVLEGKGFKDSELEAALKALTETSSPEADALDRIKAIGKVNGTPPSKQEDPDLFGPSRIRAAYASK